MRDLGVVMDGTMNYSGHVRAIVNKAKRNLGLIMRHAKIFRNTTTLRVLYYALVRSHIDFGGVVWDASSEIICKTLERIQKIFLRYSYFRDFSCFDNTISYRELTAGYEILLLYMTSYTG